MHTPPHLSAVRTVYRPDIDGLRALAVMSVLLFHLGFQRFGGGFVGVDVFLVISGYLITGMIKSDIERERFSLTGFLARRGRRLLPAMFLVIAASSVAAFLMLSPEHLRSFAASVATATLGVSNFLFWRESDYFDLAARMKPLLHTWTLGVEWQFYLVWPALVAFAMSARARWPAPQLIGAFAAASLVAAALAGIFWQATAFYLMPFRGFEFAIGALLLWAPPVRGLLADIAFLTGLILIAGAVLLLDGKVFHNPATMLIPTLGAALVIAGGLSSRSGAFIRSRLAAYLGQISYSVYLVHWPLIVFTEYFFFRGLTTSEAVKLGVISIGLGAILHHMFEKPIHQRKTLNLTPRSAGVVMMGLAAIAIAMPALLAMPDGLQWRVDQNALGLRYDNTKTLVSKDILGHLGCTEPCVFGKEDGPKVLVFGDSHVDHFTKMLLSRGGGRYRFHYAGSASCFNGATLTTRSPVSSLLTASCLKARETLLGWVKTYQYKAVIVGQRWLAYSEMLYRDGQQIKFNDQASVEDAMLTDVEALLKGFAGPVIVAGWAPITNTACYARPRYMAMTCPTVPLAEADTFRAVVARFKAKTALNLHFVDVAKTICPDNKICATTNRDGQILYTDSDHLSIFGALLIVPQFLSIIDR